MDKRPLHWSERAKMYPSSPAAGTGGPQRSGRPQRAKRPKESSSRTKAPKRSGSRMGLVVILSVVLVAAAAAALVFFWYLPSKNSDTGDSELQASSTAPTQPSQTTPTTEAAGPVTGPLALAKDIEAQALVRNAMTVVESVYADVGTFEPAIMTAALLSQMEPSTTFVVRESDVAASAPQAFAGERTVDFFGTGSGYALGTTSESGVTFGVTVTITPAGKKTTFFTNGQEADWTGAASPVLGGGVTAPQ